MSVSPYIHKWNDGRGNRDVFVNGKLVKQVFYAHVRKGIVRYFPRPLRVHKYGKRVITRTLRGEVTVQLRKVAQ